jgi:hypothetical protein
LDFIQQPKHQQKWNPFNSKYSIKIRKRIGQPKICRRLQKNTKEQIALDLSFPFRTWLEKSHQNGDHHQIWQLIIEEGSTALTNPEIKPASFQA